jgi:hypothetical protein
MLCEIVNLLYTVRALVAGKAAQDNQNDTVPSFFFGRKRDSFSCWSGQREVGRLSAHSGSLAEGGHCKEQIAGDSENGSPESTKVNSGGPLGSARQKGKIGHEEALLLWSAHLTSGLQKSYSALLLLFTLRAEIR